MRRGFTQQLAINITPIEEVEVPKVKRDHMANLLAALQHLYSNKEWSLKVEAILGNTINTGKRATGRRGMSLWEIFVLAQTRLCMNISYDTLLNLANFHTLLREVLGVQPNDYTTGYQYSRQNIIDNVSLLDDDDIKQINNLIVEMGHAVFKKKETTALSVKTDSFVVETETYFPTDYRLLYDSARKCLEIIGKLNKKYNFGSWRQWKDTRNKLKSLYRSFGKVTSSGGKNKESREQLACTNYLKPCKNLYKKVTDFLNHQAPLLYEDKAALAAIMELEWYKAMLEKHIDLLERRILQKEIIPHSEKVFSIFLPFTEFINKGKKNPSVEIGKMLFVTTDQYHLIIDYHQGEQLKDKDAIIAILDRIIQRHLLIASLSTDKGFSTKANRALIKEVYPEIKLVMPKKGKRNQEEEKEEKGKSFRKLRNAHSAIESNINELENRGLDRCPDRSARNFTKYVGLAVCAYNLHKIGRELISIQLEKDKKQKRKLARAA